MADRLRPAAELAVEQAGVRARDRVLDLACGTGNAALLAAGAGARAVGVDFEPVLLELARRRDLGERVDWRRGDVTKLGLGDGEFSMVVSIFGVMYAGDQAAAARELARCCAPGGRIALAAWTPGGFMPTMGSILAPYLPAPPPSTGPPSRWGDEASVAELLGWCHVRLRATSRHELVLTFADRRAAAEFLIRTAGHVIRERPRLEQQDRWSNLVADLCALIDERNRGGRGQVQLPLEYLLVLGEPQVT